MPGQCTLCVQHCSSGYRLRRWGWIGAACRGLKCQGDAWTGDGLWPGPFVKLRTGSSRTGRLGGPGSGGCQRWFGCDLMAGCCMVSPFDRLREGSRRTPGCRRVGWWGLQVARKRPVRNRPLRPEPRRWRLGVGSCIGGVVRHGLPKTPDRFTTNGGWAVIGGCGG